MAKKKKAEEALAELGVSFNKLTLATADIQLVENPRHVLYQDRVKLPVDQSLVQSMRDHGFISTIIVGEEYEEEGFGTGPSGARRFLGYLVVVGRQRFKAARVAEVKEIPTLNIGDISLVPKSALLRLVVEENELRQDTNTLEKAQEAQRLMDAKLQELKPKDWPEEIAWKPSKVEKSEAMEFTAGCFGVSVNWLGRMLKLLREDTSPRLLEAIKKDEISFRAAVQLAGMTAEEQEEVLEKLEPVRKAKAKAAGDSEGKGKGKGRISVSEVSAVTRSAKVQLERDWLIKISKRRSTPAEVKEFIKRILDGDLTGLPYFPGNLEPVSKSKSKAAEAEADDDWSFEGDSGDDE